MRRAWRAALVAALGLAAATTAATRPFTVEDLLRTEAVGQVLVTPDGRHVVVERRRPYREAARFDADRLTDLYRTTLEVHDLRGADPPRRIGPPDRDAGYIAGPLSPDGARLAVFRLKAGRLDLGVAELHTGAVRWLGITPEFPSPGRTVQWLGPDRLLAIALADGVQPYLLRTLQPQLSLPERWARTAAGGEAVAVVGSGADLALHPRDPPARLVSADLASGRIETLAQGAFTDLELAPGGELLALLEGGEVIGLSADRPVQGPYGTGVRRTRLRVLDLATRRLTEPCPGCDLLPHLLAWSDGGRLLAFARADGEPWTAGRLVVLEPGATRVRDAPAHGLRPDAAGRPLLVRAGWWGETPIVLGRRAPPASAATAASDAAVLPDRADWFALTKGGAVPLTSALPAPPAGLPAVGRDGLRFLAGGDAWRIARPGAKPGREARAVTWAGPVAAPPIGRTDMALRRGPSPVISSPPSRALRRLGAAEPGGPVLPLPEGATLLAISPAGLGAVVKVTTPAGELVAWRSPAGERPLFRLNAHLAEVDAPRITAVPHEGPDGQPLTSWLVHPATPASSPASGPPPLVVWPYLGAAYAAPPSWLQPASADVMAAPLLASAQGYAVLIPSLPLPERRDAPADGVADRILGIAEAALRQSPGAFDPDRIAVWGLSFGGYTALAAAAQTDRFRAIVAAAPITDLVSMYGEFSPHRRVHPEQGVGTPFSAGWAEAVQPKLGVPPWANPGLYARASPALQAHRIRTPVLLAHGDLDEIPVGQSEEMFSALYRLGRDARLATFFGERHAIRSPGNIVRYYDLVFGFLAAKLPPGPAHRAQASQ